MAGFRPRFFIASSDILAGMLEPVPHAGLGGVEAGAEAALTSGDSYHALRVLRLGEGDYCEVVVGAAVYAAMVVRADDPVRVRFVKRLEGTEAGARYSREVGLVQALGRPAAMDYVFEKGTEVGASFFILVRAGSSPGKSETPPPGRMARWRRIVEEAAKQSKQTVIPSVDLAESIDGALAALDAARTLSVVLEPGASVGLSQTLMEQRAEAGRVALWVGPEGGWSASESERFSVAGVQAARLSRGVLRTETAGPVAVAVARVALEDW